jgi:hypothetical protein
MGESREHMFRTSGGVGLRIFRKQLANADVSGDVGALRFHP